MNTPDAVNKVLHAAADLAAGNGNLLEPEHILMAITRSQGEAARFLVERDGADLVNHIVWDELKSGISLPQLTRSKRTEDVLSTYHRILLDDMPQGFSADVLLLLVLLLKDSNLQVLAKAHTPHVYEHIGAFGAYIHQEPLTGLEILNPAHYSLDAYNTVFVRAQSECLARGANVFHTAQVFLALIELELLTHHSALEGLASQAVHDRLHTEQDAQVGMFAPQQLPTNDITMLILDASNASVLGLDSSQEHSLTISPKLLRALNAALGYALIAGRQKITPLDLLLGLITADADVGTFLVSLGIYVDVLKDSLTT